MPKWEMRPRGSPTKLWKRKARFVQRGLWDNRMRYFAHGLRQTNRPDKERYGQRGRTFHIKCKAFGISHAINESIKIPANFWFTVYLKIYGKNRTDYKKEDVDEKEKRRGSKIVPSVGSEINPKVLKAVWEKATSLLEILGLSQKYLLDSKLDTHF